MKKYILILISLLLFFVKISVAQQALPNYMTEQEKQNLPFYIKHKSTGITTPHPLPLRTAAEWEEMQGILISWDSYYQIFLTEIIRYAREECNVYIYCSDSSTLKNTLTTAGVQLSNIYYIQSPTNSVWIRDYGPNNVYKDKVDSLFLVDWVYNRNRPLDDVSPAIFANRLNIPLYEATSPPTDLVNTGGNFMSDGFGNAFASNLVLDENATVTQFNSTPKTKQDVDSIMRHFMGITRYVNMTNLPYDGIHHIDMHMKLLDEETILVGQYPIGVADGPQIEANINYILNNFNSVFGTPYRIIRIPMPPDSSYYNYYPDNSGYYLTYTNSLIINKTILVPTYYQQYDTTALRIYREAMPGYRVIGINSYDIIPASGTIHCTTHEIATTDPLLISHQRLHDTDNFTSPYQVDAYIFHKTNIANASIYYRTDTLYPYTSVSMSLTNVSTNMWTGYIPPQPVGTTIYYYIQANANSGKTQVRPMTAPGGYWKFNILNPSSIKKIKNIELSVFTFKDNLTIKLNIPEKDNINITIYDLLGNKISDIYNGIIDKGEKQITYNTQLINNGLYIVSINSGNGKIRKKVYIY